MISTGPNEYACDINAHTVGLPNKVPRYASANAGTSSTPASSSKTTSARSSLDGSFDSISISSLHSDDTI